MMNTFFTPVAQPLTEEDIDLLPALQPEGWPDIRPSYRMYLSLPFCRPYKFLKDDKIVGLGTAIHYGKTAWLAHIITHPENRKQGIGSLVTGFLVDELQQKGCESILLIATDLGEPIYAKHGFEREEEYVFLSESTMPLPEANTHIEDITEDTLPQVLSLDKSVYGEERSMLLLPHMQGGKVYVKEGKVLGFYMPALGEGPVIAETEEAAQALLRIKHSEKTTKVGIPKANARGIQFLGEHGFKPFKSAWRMRLGKEVKWQPERCTAE